MRQHIVNHWPLGPGDTCLGEPVEKRTLYSITSAARRLGVSTDIAREMLSTVERATQGEEKRLNAAGLYSLDHVAATQKIVEKLVSSKVVQEKFGFLEKDFTSMQRDGFFKPELGNADKALWRLEAFDKFFDEVEKHTKLASIYPADPRWMSISKLCRQCRIRPSRVFECIFDGQFSEIVVVRSVKRFEGILIKPDPDWLNSIGIAQEEISIAEFAKRTSMIYPIARKLVDAGLIATKKMRLPAKARAQQLISPKELERFRALYISSGELVNLTTLAPWTLRTFLNRICIQSPGLAWKQTVPIFEWAEVEEKLVCRWPPGEAQCVSEQE